MLDQTDGRERCGVPLPRPTVTSPTSVVVACERAVRDRERGGCSGHLVDGVGPRNLHGGAGSGGERRTDEGETEDDGRRMDGGGPVRRRASCDAGVTPSTPSAGAAWR